MNTTNFKIKLAAIARDEAAYLAEWVFHHLTFGFDEIEVYVNNTTDNSMGVLENIAELYPVIVTNADELYQKSENNFQSLAYQEITNKAIKDGFSHLMFLDIDEFWTPADFKTTIKEAIVDLNFPEVINFNWLLHCDESEFSNCYKPTLNVKPNPHIKTLFKLDAPWKKVGIHNVLGKALVYTRGDGSEYLFGESEHCGLTDNKCLSHKYFVVHRMYRSELEYISLIGRGRANRLKVKDNRSGYYDKGAPFEKIKFDSALLLSYYSHYNEFIAYCNLSKLITDGRKFVSTRFEQVLNWSSEANDEQVDLFYKIFSNIDLPIVVSARRTLRQKMLTKIVNSIPIVNLSWRSLFFMFLAKVTYALNFKGLAYKLAYSSQINSGNIDVLLECINSVFNPRQDTADSYADFYRDIALQLHKKNEFVLAYFFISKAKECRPRGPYINKLYNEFMKDKNMLENAGKN